MTFNIIDDIQFNGVLTFSNSANSSCVSITPVDNVAVGDDVYVNLMLTSSDRAASQLDTAILVIRDNDSELMCQHHV